MTQNLKQTLIYSNKSLTTKWFAVPNVERFVDQHMNIIRLNIYEVLSEYSPERKGYDYHNVFTIDQ